MLFTIITPTIANVRIFRLFLCKLGGKIRQDMTEKLVYFRGNYLTLQSYSLVSTLLPLKVMQKILTRLPNYRFGIVQAQCFSVLSLGISDLKDCKNW